MRLLVHMGVHTHAHLQRMFAHTHASIHVCIHACIHTCTRLITWGTITFSFFQSTPIEGEPRVGNWWYQDSDMCRTVWECVAQHLIAFMSGDLPGEPDVFEHAPDTIDALMTLYPQVAGISLAHKTTHVLHTSAHMHARAHSLTHSCTHIPYPHTHAYIYTSTHACTRTCMLRVPVRCRLG